MKLTEIQRKFITDKLGVKAREKKQLHIRTEAEKKDDTITGALDDYLRREAKVLEIVRELEKVPGTDKLVTALEVEIAAVQARVKAATRDTGEQVLKQAYKELVKQNHPDRVHSMAPAFRELAEAETKKLNIAYADAISYFRQDDMAAA